MLNIKVIWRSRSRCWQKGLDLSNIVCEYEVNPLTNDKVISKEIQNFLKIWLKSRENKAKTKRFKGGNFVNLLN